MKYSIIVPVHNAELTIERCVANLIRQSEEIQIILVENNSSDNSLKICRKLQEQHNQIELYINEEKGVSATRNIGLKFVNGDIIGFCDSDDYYEEYSLNHVSKIFENSNIDIVFTGFTKIDNGILDKVSVKKEEVIGSGKAIDYIACNPLIMGSVWNKFFRKDLIPFMEFPTELSHMEDTYFNVRLLSIKNNLKIYVSKINTYFYIKNNNSATNVIEKCFDVSGHSNYCISCYKMLRDLNLSKSNQKSVKDQIYRISIGGIEDKRIQTDELKKKFFRDDIMVNWWLFTKRVFRYDWKNRIKLVLKGLIVIANNNFTK